MMLLSHAIMHADAELAHRVERDCGCIHSGQLDHIVLHISADGRSLVQAAHKDHETHDAGDALPDAASPGMEARGQSGIHPGSTTLVSAPDFKAVL